jgi:Uri superfamily endonuclease
MSSDLPADPGTYLLLLRSRNGGAVRIGALGELRLCDGYYVYVGSARGPGGLRGRVARHLRGVSRPHWHIDYLRRRSEPAAVWFRTGRVRREHRWARLLASVPMLDPALPRFGASDCRCRTHLYYSPAPPSLQCLREWLSDHRVTTGRGGLLPT